MYKKATKEHSAPLILPCDGVTKELDKERGLLLQELRKQCRDHRITQKEICEQLGLPKNFFRHSPYKYPHQQSYQRNKEVSQRAKYELVFVGKGVPGARKDGTMFKHRKVMSDYLGRPLEKWEVVHHRNRIRNDNRIENLELLSQINHPTCQKCPFYTELQALKKKYPNLTVE